MECYHRGGRWLTKKVKTNQEDDIIEAPDDQGNEKWKPFAVSDGFLFFRRYEPCQSCKRGRRVMNDFYERLN